VPLRLLQAAVLLAAASAPIGCGLSPKLVADDGPLFTPGFPWIGVRTDGALCSLASVGPDATNMVTPPAAVPEAESIARRCANPGAGTGFGERVSQPIGPSGTTPAHGYLYRAPHARGIIVLFSGLGMPTDGWVTQRFASLAAQRGYTTFALIRDETSIPIRFDPVAEAHRGIFAARAIRTSCGVDPAALTSFLGYSLGGLEALLAARDAASVAPDLGPTKAVVLDPVLDPPKAAHNLDKWFRSVAVDAMQDVFHRILRGRYHEKSDTSFDEVLARSDAETSQTRLARDAPSTWLPKTTTVSATIFLSKTDPALGDEQRAALAHVPASIVRRDIGSPGHIPFACEPSIFSIMLDEAGR